MGNSLSKNLVSRGGALPEVLRISQVNGLCGAENLHRQDLNPLEEAAAYQQLVQDFGLTQEHVAERVGRSRSAVANTIRLLQLSPAVQRLLVEGQLSAGHGRALLVTADRALQEALAEQIVREGLTVRDIENLLRADPTGAGADASRPPSRPTPPKVADAGVLELEELLAARLDTRVRVQLGKGPGKLVVEFADLDDLERIYRVITPPGTIV